MARERGEGNACWHLASNSRAFPSCSWPNYVGLREKGDLGEKNEQLLFIRPRTPHPSRTQARAGSAVCLLVLTYLWRQTLCVGRQRYEQIRYPVSINWTNALLFGKYLYCTTSHCVIDSWAAHSHCLLLFWVAGASLPLFPSTEQVQFNTQTI